MTDRFLLTVLMACLTLGGAFAIGMDLARDRALAQEAQVRVVRLEPVVITAKRLTPTEFAATERTEPAARRAQ